MKEEKGHIFSIFDEVIPQKEKESLLQQKSMVLWFTGLSGSGKTSIAKWLERKLQEEGVLCAFLDGDNIRTGLSNNLGFSLEDRLENIRRIAEVAKLFNSNGLITIATFVSPTFKMRNLAKEIIGEDFHEVFINTPLEICEERDVKGLYKKARSGEIANFTGITSPFEEPETPFIEIRTENKEIEECGLEIFKAIKDKIKLK
ncbi:MAG: adenylyl-sulfate kinase [Bacteroidota bacterium]